MAKKKTNLTRRLVTRRRRTKRRSTAMRSKAVKNTPSPIVTAVRSLLSFLPGQSVISPLADFAFKYFGLTTTDLGSNFSDVKVSMVGLYAAIPLRVRDLIAFSPAATRSEHGEIYRGGVATTRVALVKALWLKVDIHNTTPRGTKQGNWAAVIRPNLGYDETKFSAFTFKVISDTPGAIVLSADRDISLAINSFPPYWTSGRELQMDEVVATIYIGFEDLNRTAYTEFKSDDFSCTVNSAAGFRILASSPGSASQRYFYDIQSVYSHDGTISCYYNDKNNRKTSNHYPVYKTTCKDGQKNCILDGTTKAFVDELDAMAIDNLTV